MAMPAIRRRWTAADVRELTREDRPQRLTPQEGMWTNPVSRQVKGAPFPWNEDEWPTRDKPMKP